MSAYDTVRKLLDGARPGPKVETVSREPVASLTTVPKPIKEWADGAGYRLSWQQGSDMRITQIHGQGIIPLRVPDDLPDDVMAKLKGLTQFLVTDGVLKRADACLCIQTLDAYEDSMEQVRLRSQRQRDGFDANKFKEDAEALGVQAVMGEDWAQSPKDLVSSAPPGYRPI